jgi:hypothetical protein
MKRWREIDELRGLMLVLMTLTHLPTRLSGPLGQPLGFVSAAEGFVFLSAFMAGMIFSRRAIKDGMWAMCKAFLLRGLKLYACHVAMLLFLFTIIAAIGIKTDQQTIKNLISFYLQEPITALMSSLILVYNPPLLDILPMYVAFMALSPWILTIGLRSWTPVILASGVIWLIAQFGVEKELYQALRDLVALKVPFHETGAFDLLAWQLVWISGLWLGARVATTSNPAPNFPSSLIYIALAVAITGLLTRHIFGQAPLAAYPKSGFLIDKWHLGPLRLINFLALLLLTLRFGSHFKAAIRCRFLELLGAASLPVFCAHLAVVLLALALIGDKQGAIPLWQELALIAGTLMVMSGIAWIFREKAKTDADLAADNPAPLSARAAR